eukprot:7242300-Alexandrium_andersonii.AAC.1
MQILGTLRRALHHCCCTIRGDRPVAPATHCLARGERARSLLLDTPGLHWAPANQASKCWKPT